MSTPARSAQSSDRLRISEAAQLVMPKGASAVDADGNVQVHLMRPCLGKGRGRHVYEAAMLKQHAETGHFNDWPMYVDHESPEAKQKAGGLPRSLRDVGGRVVETWWDPTVPAEGRFGQGAVVAKAKPIPWVRELIEHDPMLVNVSLNTFATGVRPTNRAGRPAYVVEGFVPDGSADWVTKAGAGGKVVQLMEAYMETLDDERDERTELLEAMSDEEMAEHIRQQRPAVAEALTNPAPGHGEEDDMTEQEIQEAALSALRSEEGREVLSEVVAEAANSAVQEALRQVLPSAIGKAAEVIEANAERRTRHALRMGKLGERAQHKIMEASLHDALKADLGGRFQQIDLEDKTDGDGTVIESAEDQLDALVEAEIKRAGDLQAKLSPTGVRGNGDGGGQEAHTPGGGEGGEGSGDEVAEADQEAIQEARFNLQQAGVPLSAYGIQEADGDAKPEGKKAEPVAS